MKNLRVAATIGICAMAIGMSSPALAIDRRIKIDNQSDLDAYEMYVSNTGSGKWGPDQLGRGTISAHHYMIWNIDDGTGYCKFDFKFVMEDGTKRFKWGYNVCTAYELDIVD